MARRPGKRRQRYTFAIGAARPNVPVMVVCARCRRSQANAVNADDGFCVGCAVCGNETGAYA